LALREIISVPDPLLREVSKPVQNTGEALQRLLNDMADTMYGAPGIGLAGIQIAVPLRVVVVDCEQRAKRDGEPEEDAANVSQTAVHTEEAERNPIFLINPQLVSVGDVTSTYEEGCLSIPDYFAEVERPASCRVEYMDRAGEKRVLEADGLLATCLQHEIDHLDGKLFIDHISKLKRDRVIKKFTKIARQSGKGNAEPVMIG